MTSASKGPVRILAWGLLGVVLATTVVLFVRSQMSLSNLPRIRQVQPFSLTNQLGQAFSSSELKGRVWVADIIFTRCAGPCPRMTEEMSKIQTAFPAEERLSLVTLTTDPDYDKPSILKIYGEKFGADHSRWHFLTGTKPAIKALAVDSLMLSALEKEEGQRENENDLFIHSTMFILVDKSGMVRAVYESLEPGFQERIQGDIRALLKEDR